MPIRKTPLLLHAPALSPDLPRPTPIRCGPDNRQTRLAELAWPGRDRTIADGPLLAASPRRVFPVEDHGVGGPCPPSRDPGSAHSMPLEGLGAWAAVEAKTTAATSAAMTEIVRVFFFMVQGTPDSNRGTRSSSPIPGKANESIIASGEGKSTAGHLSLFTASHRSPPAAAEAA